MIEIVMSLECTWYKHLCVHTNALTQRPRDNNRIRRKLKIMQARAYKQ